MAGDEARNAAITCVIADDSPLLVDEVADFLATNGFEVVARTSSGEEALAAIEAHSPRVAVLSLVPRLSGIDVAKLARERSPKTATILYAAAEVGDSLVEGLGAGVRGFVGRAAPLDTLLRAIELAAAGAMFVDPALAPTLIRGTVTRTLIPLSPRERDVLHLLADGKTNEEIGKTLHISADTVRTYLRRAMQKLEADNRTHAVAIALRESFIT
jgi:DNA-binding NarL/FixJ family response regulator